MNTNLSKYFHGSSAASAQQLAGRLPLALALASVFMAGPRATAKVFHDDFNGPALSPSWQASLPNALQPGTGGVATYLGAPHYSFQTLDGASVINMTNTLNNYQRVGLSTTNVFTGSTFLYEARFNTLAQSPSNSIDSFFEIWVLNATNSSLYDIVSPFGGSYSANRRFDVASGVDGRTYDQAYNYQNNTWYRLALQGTPGHDMQAFLLSDSGTILAQQTLGHTDSFFSSGFRLGISQSVGLPLSPYPVNVDVDWVDLSPSTVPEPGAAALVLCGGLTWLGAVRARRNQGRR